MVTEVAVTPGAGEPEPDAAVVVVVADVVVVVELLVEDEHPAANTASPTATAIEAVRFPRIFPICTLPYFRLTAPGLAARLPFLRSVDGNC
jgi:hypothetical protein